MLTPSLLPGTKVGEGIFALSGGEVEEYTALDAGRVL